MGAAIGRGAVVHPSVRIWAPQNLVMLPYSCLGPYVECYNVAPVTIGACATVSQYSHLCAATHDYTDLNLPLVPKPISIGDHAWICADAFIGPGVTVGEGAVVGARSSVFKDVDPWTSVVGNPARFLKPRALGSRG
jgi:putative colanic acid biosynthesis acetyltransferase WcaF